MGKVSDGVEGDKMDSRVKVVCRFRPQDANEIANNGCSCVNFDSNNTLNICLDGDKVNFTFDQVFSMDSKQHDIFEYSVCTTVDDLFKGYNGSVLAYGQTGSGKTYTMFGPDIESLEQKGVIPRIVERIFQSISQNPTEIEFSVKVSYMEIYMERIRDLLDSTRDNLPIHEDRDLGVYVKGLSEIYVSNSSEVFEIMKKGSSIRAISSTNMNSESSRSHSIFQLTVIQRNVKTGITKSGRLYLVDLAGSEKVGKTGARGQTLEEAKKINKSLSALGNVINSLTDSRASHIPYRDSKLTRILQESLGGNSRTTLIINCSPSTYNVEETISTLRFGVRAKTIKNTVKINEEMSPSAIKKQIETFELKLVNCKRYIGLLENEIRRWRIGESIPQNDWVDISDAKIYSPKIESDTEFRMDYHLNSPNIDLFDRRDNELLLAFSEKENQLIEQESILSELREELRILRENALNSDMRNEQINLEANELRVRLDRALYDLQNANATLESLNEVNIELTREMEKVKRNNFFQEKCVPDFGDRTKAKILNTVLQTIDSNKGNHQECDIAEIKLLSSNLFELLNDAKLNEKNELLERLDHANSLVKRLSFDIDQRDDKISKLEEKLSNVEIKLKERNSHYLKTAQTIITNASTKYNELSKNIVFQETLDSNLKSSESFAIYNPDSQKSQENGKINGRRRLNSSESGLIRTKSTDVELRSRLQEFETVKKELLLDLQRKCEQIGELEVSLEQNKENQNSLMQVNSTKSQYEKIIFLERTLDHLTTIHTQLIEHNSSLKKEVSVTERKMALRNERISYLERLLVESQEPTSVQLRRFQHQLRIIQKHFDHSKATQFVNHVSNNRDFDDQINEPLRGISH